MPFSHRLLAYFYRNHPSFTVKMAEIIFHLTLYTTFGVLLLPVIAALIMENLGFSPTVTRSTTNILQVLSYFGMLLSCWLGIRTGQFLREKKKESRP